MKKATLFLLLAALLLGLAACAGGEGAAITETGDVHGEDVLEVSGTPQDTDGDEVSYETTPWTPVIIPPDFTNLTMIPDAASGDSLEVPHMWITEHGAYYVNTVYPDSDYSGGGMGFVGGGGRVVGAVSTSLVTDRAVFAGNASVSGPITLIHIIDSATGKDMVLCNRVTCPHDSEDCGAVLPDDPVDDSEFGMWGGWGGSSTLFIDDGYIYALNSGSTFYRLGLDGSGRTEYMRLPDEYDFSWSRNWLMNGKLYMMATVMIQTDDWGFTGIQAMVEVDYVNKTINEIWRGKPWSDSGENSQINVLGLWSGQVFAVESTYPEWSHTSNDQMDYYDNQKHVFFSYNATTGQRTEIFSETGDGFQGNTWNVPESGEIPFHSRRDETISVLNLRTGEVTVLAHDVSGFIFTYEERDGRLLLMRYNDDDWMTSHDIDMDLLFVDLRTGEFGEITLKTKQNIGVDFHNFMFVQFEEDGYYYVEAEREMEEQGDPMWGTWYQMARTRLGRIPIDDYWANNEDALEYLDWYTQEEWWEFLNEKMNWGTMGFARG
jgi:hypothetical protein